MAAAISLPLAYLLSVIPATGENIVGQVLRASPPFIVTAAMACLVLYKHRANIARLLSGTESRIGQKG